MVSMETNSNMEADDTKLNEEDDYKAYLAKIRHRWFTVEPIVVVYMVEHVILLRIMQQYMYQRLAVDFNITDSSNANKSSQEICLERVEKSSEMTGNEKDFHESVSFWNTLVVSLGLLPSIIVVIFIGAVSDARGRKYGLVPQIGGAVLSGVVMILVVALQLDIVVLPVIQFLCGMTGATAAVLKSTFAYIADINPPEKRFFRILLIEIGLGLGNLVGRIFFGWLIDTTGFIVPLAVYTALQLLILIYTVFFLPETIRKDPDVRSSTCASFFALPRLWLHDKDNIGQITIWVSFALIFTYGLLQDVPAMILTFIFLDPPLCWTSLLIGFYNGISFILRALGGVLLMRLLFKRAPNAALQAISLVSAALLYICLAFATETWVPFVGAGLGCGTMLLVPVTRAVASQNVSDTQQGALFAGLSLAQMLAVLIGTPVINVIYANTTPDNRGVIFLVLAGVVIVPLILVGVDWYFDHLHHANSTDSITTGAPSCEVLTSGNKSKFTIENSSGDEGQYLISDMPSYESI